MLKKEAIPGPPKRIHILPSGNMGKRGKEKGTRKHNVQMRGIVILFLWKHTFDCF